MSTVPKPRSKYLKILLFQDEINYGLYPTQQTTTHVL